MFDSTFASGAVSAPSYPSEKYLVVGKLMSCLLSALIIWRLWRFTISPALHPSHPKEFPSWMPCHAAAFFRDSNGLLSQARKHFDHSKAPFALTVLGMTFYVITQSKHSAEVYRNTETLSFEDFVQGLMKTNGNRDSAIRRMYTSLPVSKIGFPNPQGESLGVLAQKMHIHQLHPGKNLTLLQERVHAWINHHLNWGSIQQSTSPSFKGLTHIELPLYQWCSDYFVRLGQHVYFGHILAEVDHDLPNSFFQFDELIWKMLYQYPGFLSYDMSVPRSRIITSLRKYFTIPQVERKEGAAWLINSMEDEAKAIGIDEENLAIIMFHLYFAINTNTRKTAFWLLTYLIYNPPLLAAYRQEIEPAFAGHTLVNPFYIQDAANCPQVDAIWHETLRLSGWSASVRLVTQDTVIGGKLMRKGNRVLVPHRLLHFGESLFGERPNEFRPERWQRGNLSRSSSWRPFGGGKTMCSGRFLARFSVTTFVATLLRRFDLEVVGNPPFPQADEGRPVLGTMSIKEGHDFYVRLLPREI
ncbi:hypothetical protein K445DRAFT_65159 [Daldinia sp. EC12]|nr:hypothetical protein K445DRAFT_65159 [Daldinia sp. EC12]